MLAYPLVNVARPRLAQAGMPLDALLMTSPYTLELIPRIDVELVNGRVKRSVRAGVDSGFRGAHLKIPSTLARELGVRELDRLVGEDLVRSFEMSVGTLGRISVPGNPGCTLANARVLFHEGSQVLLGSDFMRDVGMTVAYDEGGRASVRCSGSAAAGVRVPVFEISLIHAGKAIRAKALFDTGWEKKAVGVPARMADELGLPRLGAETVTAHTGKATIESSRIDRIALVDLPQCHVDAAPADIIPASSPIDMPVVGEGFFQATRGAVGYDALGAFFACPATGGVARAVELRPRFAPFEFLGNDAGPAIPWLFMLGGAALGGALLWLLWPERKPVHGGRTVA